MAGRRRTPDRCVCCRQRVLPHRGDYVICRVCGWEDDGSQLNEPSGANHGMTLAQARIEYADGRRRLAEEGDG